MSNASLLSHVLLHGVRQIQDRLVKVSGALVQPGVESAHFPLNLPQRLEFALQLCVSLHCSCTGCLCLGKLGCGEGGVVENGCKRGTVVLHTGYYTGEIVVGALHCLVYVPGDRVGQGPSCLFDEVEDFEDSAAVDGLGRIATRGGRLWARNDL